jgi:hypothetical protein
MLGHSQVCVADFWALVSSWMDRPALCWHAQIQHFLHSHCHSGSGLQCNERDRLVILRTLNESDFSGFDQQASLVGFMTVVLHSLISFQTPTETPKSDGQAGWQPTVCWADSEE